MAVNRGKQFENVIRESFLAVTNTSVYRLHDDMSGFYGASNVSDFIIYHYPYQYFIECKAVHGNTLSINSNDPKRKYGNISNTQWEGMLELSKVNGVKAGVICWFVDHDITVFIPIQALQEWREQGHKSVRFDDGLNTDLECYSIACEKKRVFFEYDMKKFFERFNNDSK